MRTGVEVVEEGAKVIVELCWLLYLCIKPETSEMTFSCHCKNTNFHMFPLGTSGSRIAIGQC